MLQRNPVYSKACGNVKSISSHGTSFGIGSTVKEKFFLM